ncbi:hypothetical protein Q0Z83_042390 [Actinoplanes sichuanensis]|nr:hypothetical protein Q0Z83_042390 [Actinoplanes sichuanensis]
MFESEVVPGGQAHPPGHDGIQRGDGDGEVVHRPGELGSVLLSHASKPKLA